jgi:hypothetical protein
VTTNSPDAATDGGTLDEALVSRDSDIVFDDNTLWRFDVTAADTDIAWLKDNILLEQSIPATVTANGHDIGEVGFHYKGNVGTLSNCVDANGKQICRKLGVKIEFDAYEKPKRFYGMKKLNFNSSVWDDSLMRERLSYSTFREMDVYASRASHALVYVNGDFWGVFSMVEEVDGRFDDYRFPGKGNGNLYKECWPTSSDPAYYTAGLHTNKSTVDISAMVAFGTDVLGATDTTFPDVIAKYNDIDYLMRYLAVDRGIAANDGIMAFWEGTGWVTNHNFYWYQEEAGQRFWLIPWDMYSTFNPLTPLDWVPTWDQPPGDCSIQYTSWDTNMWYRAPGCDPLIHGFSLLDRSRYLAAVQNLLDGPFQIDVINQKIDRWSAQIADAVAQDTHGPSINTWQSALTALKSNAVVMRERTQGVHDGINTAPMGLRLGQVNDFEGVNAVSFALGTSGYTNSTSTLSYVINQNNPIAGAQDARIDFVFRDQSENASDAWQQWNMVNFAFAGWSADLVTPGITEIHFMARADQNRGLRIDIASPNDSQFNNGICLGWDASLTTTPTVFVLKLVNAAIPSWAATRPDPPNDDPNKVFSTATGLVFRVQPTGVGSTGFFGVGGSDTGYVQIDNIEFVKGTTQ